MSERELDFIHRFLPGQKSNLGPALILLHGTGGDEASSLRLGELLALGTALLSPRGKVLENGMPRFFRRLSEGVFDIEDLTFRTRELAGFVQDAARIYGLDPKSLVAVGYSNGANIAASLLLQEPGLLRAAVLLRAMVPFEPGALPDLSGTDVYLASGRRDQLIAPDNAARLAEILRESGAGVEHRWTEGGHGLLAEDVAGASQWLSRFVGSQSGATPGDGR